MSNIFLMVMNSNRKRSLVLPEVKFRELVHISNNCDDPAVAREELQHFFNDIVTSRQIIYVINQFAMTESEYFKSVCDTSSVTGCVDFAGDVWGIGVGLSPEEAVLNCFAGYTMSPSAAREILTCGQLFSD